MGGAAGPPSAAVYGGSGRSGCQFSQRVAPGARCWAIRLNHHCSAGVAIVELAVMAPE